MKYDSRPRPNLDQVYLEFRIPIILRKVPLVSRRMVRLDQITQWQDYSELVAFGDKRALLRGSTLYTVAGEFIVLETFDEVSAAIRKHGQLEWFSQEQMIQRFNDLVQEKADG